MSVGAYSIEQLTSPPRSRYGQPTEERLSMYRTEDRPRAYGGGEKMYGAGEKVYGGNEKLYVAEDTLFQGSEKSYPGGEKLYGAEDKLYRGSGKVYGGAEKQTVRGPVGTRRGHSPVEALQAFRAEEHTREGVEMAPVTREQRTRCGMDVQSRIGPEQGSLDERFRFGVEVQAKHAKDSSRGCRTESPGAYLPSPPGHCDLSRSPPSRGPSPLPGRYSPGASPSPEASPPYGTSPPHGASPLHRASPPLGASPSLGASPPLGTSPPRGVSPSTEDGEPTDKPAYSYIALISKAILSCPEKKMVLSDIYQHIMDNFSYYNNQERAWRNSIRHNLSLNECFIKAGRAENGKGNYWAIHPACAEDFSKGDYRRRQARRRARSGGLLEHHLNISALPYNYRCGIGYVPMTTTPVFGFHPYGGTALPYLPGSLPGGLSVALPGALGSPYPASPYPGLHSLPHGALGGYTTSPRALTGLPGGKDPVSPGGLTDSSHSPTGLSPSGLSPTALSPPLTHLPPSLAASLPLSHPAYFSPSSSPHPMTSYPPYIPSLW